MAMGEGFFSLAGLYSTQISLGDVCVHLSWY